MVDIPRQRLLNQHMAQPGFKQPGEALAWLAAAQAQDFYGAKWALGLRTQAATDEQIERAFDEGAILRTHLLRPTWHFVTPADIGWLLALTAGRVQAVNATMYRRLGLDGATFKRSNEALARALQGGQYLTRDELRGALQQAGISTEGPLRMSYLMMRAELDGIVCSGPRRGKQFTYALLEERAPQARRLERQAALAELARRYFLSRGPATAHDFARWSGLTVSEARQGLEAVKGQLQQEQAGGQVYWFPPPRPAGQEPAPRAYLLSAYDEYLSGYKDRSAVVSAENGARLSALGNALGYVIVIDGQVVGSWKRSLRKDAVVIETNIFKRPAEAEERAVSEAAQRYGAFLQLPVELVQAQA